MIAIHSYIIPLAIIYSYILTDYPVFAENESNISG